MSRDAASYGAHAVCRQELVTGLVEQMRTFRAGLGEGLGLKLDLNYNFKVEGFKQVVQALSPSPCLLYTSPSPRDGLLSRMPSSA